MKKGYLKTMAIVLSGTIMTTSCVGSFTMFNKLAHWNKNATDSKILNEIIFLIISPAYAFCGIADALVLNSIEFWSGSNPMAENIGKTKNVRGEDGKIYAVTTLKDGYKIVTPNGDTYEFIYDKETDSWSKVQDGKTIEIFRFNENGTIRANLAGRSLDVTLDTAGLLQVADATGHGCFYAMR